jgi:acetyl-CoA carboxylase carboxyltransferase component
MEGRTLAIGAYHSKLDDQFQVASRDPAEAERVRQGMREVEERIEHDMDPVTAAARRDVDEVVTLAELRLYLEAAVTMAYQAPGARRIKNPRIWSLHDLQALGL